MKWYFPSANGDIRVETHPENPKHTLLTIIQPTPHEQDLLARFVRLFRERKWLDREWLWDPLGEERQTVGLGIGLEVVGPLLVDNFKAGQATLTAVIFKDGRVETVTGSGSEAKALVKEAQESPKPEAKAAATVKRPTPCCPFCETGPLDAATEVLYDFLTPDERDQWEREQMIEVEGGLSGHRYLVMHRHSALAALHGKFIFDLDDGAVLHCHDSHVPPPEEVLAGKLLLEHREDWIRNEATVLAPGRHGPRLRFKNPFGNLFDGVESAFATKAYGELMLKFAAAGGSL